MRACHDEEADPTGNGLESGEDPLIRESNGFEEGNEVDRDEDVDVDDNDSDEDDVEGW